MTNYFGEHSQHLICHRHEAQGPGFKGPGIGQ